jgi:hypothetical protein
MSRVMLTASEARLKALQDIYVLREIRDLEEAVIFAAAEGKVEVVVQTTSTMAKNPTDEGSLLANEYYNTWTGVRDDRQKHLQMVKVIQYFSDLGYTIERQTNPVGSTTFQWVIAW